MEGWVGDLDLVPYQTKDGDKRMDFLLNSHLLTPMCKDQNPLTIVGPPVIGAGEVGSMWDIWRGIDQYSAMEKRCCKHGFGVNRDRCISVSELGCLAMSVPVFS